MTSARDFVGYGDAAPDLRWPGGARLAVNFVLNYEEGSEYSIDDGDGRSDAVLTEVAQARVPQGIRDLGAESMFEYDSDAYNDDLPYWVAVDGRAHLVVPYSLATNDAKLVGGPLVTARAFGEFLIDSAKELLADGTHARMMSVGMHARILGQPGRIGGLRVFMEHIQDRGDVWICRRADLAAHFRAHVPPPKVPPCT